ncbi:bifunctional riboflavin kinase/FAD synthetase [Halobacillus sp. A5]|uniref:bifunctional riboflavin kinase/FAD synthetase n=1 Tax=Halobacillus sp. A5 TaxID=2880263 RepID=UPI0020A6402E|nr:bifunctional riboflavin kinase/FAD synthetase [Halobacillus sp. A5]MCP3029400.1 bifunctional riboflavin kinase/FAD synthetase [Halobacillus sp. A5]
METIDVSAVPPKNNKRTILLIGKFDGLHLGHQKLLSRARALRQKDEEIAVFGFSDHPLWVLKGEAAYEKSLSSYQDKLQLLEKAGVDRYYHINFTKEYAQITPEQFVKEQIGQLNVSCIVIGEGFRFGKGRHADVNGLKELCLEQEIKVAIVPHVSFQHEKVSSTTIRHHTAAGRMEAAQSMLHRPFEMTGVVEKGEALGRQLGFPTLNVGRIDEYVRPKPGVYIGVVQVQGSASDEYYYTLISAGYRPTVNGDSYKVEAYLLDFSGDLYERTVTVQFLRFMRGEENFDGLDELVQQMEKDEEEARGILGLPNNEK